jgi:TPR repeat protein
VRRDFRKATEHFNRQAELGEAALAYYTLGSMAIHGIEGAGDENEAIAQFRKAVELGHVDSVIRLASLLEAKKKVGEAAVALKQFWEKFEAVEALTKHAVLFWNYGDDDAKKAAARELKIAADMRYQPAIDFRRDKGIH